jgi:hypothetical protein
VEQKVLSEVFAVRVGPCHCCIEVNVFQLLTSNYQFPIRDLEIGAEGKKASETFSKEGGVREISVNWPLLKIFRRLRSVRVQVVKPTVRSTRYEKCPALPMRIHLTPTSLELRSQSKQIETVCSTRRMKKKA